MKKYFLTKALQDDGQHILHSASCGILPPEEELVYLGFFKTSPIAFEQAQKIYADVADKITPCNDCIGVIY